MTAEVGKISSRTEGAAPRRPRGAHAAARRGRLGSAPGGIPLAAVRSATAATLLAATRPAALRAAAAASAAARMGSAAARSVGRRSVLADVVAALIVAGVVPLALLQMPDAIAWAIPPRFAAAPDVTAVLRASGLALIAMAVAAPLGGLAVRQFRAWPVLMAGLGLVAAADIGGSAARTIVQIGLDRAAHGAGAGVALAAAVAVAAERPGPARRLLAGWWAVCAVGGLGGAAALVRLRMSGGDWQAALQPFPWLTGAALGLSALYAVLADGAVTAGIRAGFPVAERAQLALLTGPVAGMGAITVAVTYHRTDRTPAVIAAAVATMAMLAGLALMTGRAGPAGWSAVVSAVIGFALAPAAGTAAGLLRLPAHQVLVLAVAAGGALLTGAALAVVLPPRRTAPLATAALLLATVGYATASYATASYATASYAASGYNAAGHAAAGHAAAGHAAASYAAAGHAAGGASWPCLVVACVLIAGGLGAALAGTLRGTGAAGAMCGLSLMLAGALAGFLADGAVELRALSAGGRDVPGETAALLAAETRWSIVAAALTSAVALAMFARGRTRLTSVAEVESEAGAPVRSAGRAPEHG